MSRHKPSVRARQKQETPQDEQVQRLDDARAEFRVEWQAKLDRKRQQAKRALGHAGDLKVLAELMAGGGAICGLFVGAVIGGGTGHPVVAVIIAVFGTLLGLGLALVPVALLRVCGGICRRRGERLEREAHELERS